MNTGSSTHHVAAHPQLYALAEAAGLITHWDNAQGQAQVLAPEAIQGVLQAMAIACANAAQIEASRIRLATHAASLALPSLLTAELNTTIVIPWPQDQASPTYTLTLEDGSIRTGTAQRNGTSELLLPGVSIPGYHSLRLAACELTLAVAPARCYGVDDASQDADPRLWGIAVQIYALRHDRSGGIGDFGSLALCCEAAARAGAAAVAINPVHAGFSADPKRYSPYAPSSRLFLNPLYIAPEALFGAAAVDDAVTALGVSEHVAHLDSVAEIDWPAFAQTRLAILRHLFEQRGKWLKPDLLEAFRGFCIAGGEALQRHARFETLHEFYLQCSPPLPDWRNWPAVHRDPASPEVDAFAARHHESVAFHQFLQWLAAQGLDHAQNRGRRAGMTLGLIADLAVGTDAAGSHVWSDQDEFLHGLEIGAPPDLYSAHGQAWGIAAFSPDGLRRHGYRAWLQVLRAVLAQTGGVRIDHVLGLNRLWLIPQGASPTAGAYLRFPFDDMMRLIALESWRARAIVIGENLGTVPDGFNARLSQRGLLGISVLWFERDRDPAGGETFRAAGEWSRDAIATTGTHDLPTMAGWWSGRDLEWREQLELLEPGLSGAQARRQRQDEREALWQLWCATGVSSGVCPAPDSLAPVPAALAFIGSTAAPLVLIPLEDLLGLREQPNLPGTIDIHPNWRRRLSLAVDTLFESHEVVQRIAALNLARSNARGNRP